MLNLKEFVELNLKPQLIEALRAMNFHSMTEVQDKTIPLLLEGRDVVVRSKTGSGKTGAFLVPIMQMLQHGRSTEAIVVVPTRELAIQVNSVAEKMAAKLGLRITIVYGGASINIQMQSLHRGSNIVIGTPGRILDLIERGALHLDKIRHLVLDEADLMLNMGFIEDVERIILMTPSDRQMMLFSATMPREITDIARKYMKSNAMRLTVGEEEDLTVNTITHNYFIANGRLKFSALLAYIDKFNPKKCIIFTETKRESDLLHRFLVDNKLNAMLMHGGLTQSRRERALMAFKEHGRFLISTNLASRGLDIPNITDVINFDAPDDPHIYVHRVGRSARMGKDGRAFTLFSYEQRDLLMATERKANVKMSHIDLDTAKYKDIQLPEMRRRREGGFGQRGFNRESSRPDSRGYGNRGRRNYGSRDNFSRHDNKGWDTSGSGLKHHYKPKSSGHSSSERRD